MAGNLADLVLVDRTGVAVPGKALDYNGQPAGYAKVPADTITYISAHDNETWFDALNVKLPQALAMPERARMHALGEAIVLLSQGIPFLHAGDELMRSKSCDKNSFDSGDWWNRIDWTGQHSAWGSGLPPAGSNQGDWPAISPLLADPALKPGPADLAATFGQVEDLLRIRRSSQLFRLRTADDIQAMTSFFNVGPGQVPGLLVTRIASPRPLHGDWAQAVVVVNATPQRQVFRDDAFRRQRFRLHPVQHASRDPVVRQAGFACEDGSFTVPPRTAAVFVSRHGTASPAPGCGTGDAGPER